MYSLALKIHEAFLDHTGHLEGTQKKGPVGNVQYPLGRARQTTDQSEGEAWERGEGGNGEEAAAGRSVVSTFCPDPTGRGLPGVRMRGARCACAAPPPAREAGGNLCGLAHRCLRGPTCQACAWSPCALRKRSSARCSRSSVGSVRMSVKRLQRNGI